MMGIRWEGGQGMGTRKRIDGNPKAQQYGRFFWLVELGNDEWVSVYANRVEVSGGAVVFYGIGHEAADGRPDYERPKGDDYPVVAFGAGQWQTFYAASLLDGHPVAVDRWVENIPD
jgi:hypothetical protein